MAPLRPMWKKNEIELLKCNHAVIIQHLSFLFQTYRLKVISRKQGVQSNLTRVLTPSVSLINYALG